MIVKFSLEDVGGMEVVCYSSGMEAIDNMAKIQPDLVLLDVMMPEMDGVEIFDKINKKFDKIPIIFLTAKGKENETEDLKRMGAIGVIVKPFDPLSLHEQIKQMWEEWG